MSVVGLAGARFATGELFMERRLDSRVGMEDLRGDWYCETDTCFGKKKKLLAGVANQGGGDVGRGA